jgi:hypothetical protein
MKLDKRTIDQLRRSRELLMNLVADHHPTCCCDVCEAMVTMARATATLGRPGRWEMMSHDKLPWDGERKDG